MTAAAWGLGLPVACACGCGRRFVQRTWRHRYATRACAKNAWWRTTQRAATAAMLDAANRACPWCRVPFRQVRKSQMFCGARCRIAARSFQKQRRNIAAGLTSKGKPRVKRPFLRKPWLSLGPTTACAHAAARVPAGGR